MNFRQTRLILLTHQFPFLWGDASFIVNEIDALAAKFDEVVVFTWQENIDFSEAKLPKNVLYKGPIEPTKRINFLRGMLYSILNLQMVLRHMLQGKTLNEKMRNLKATLIGSSIASTPLLVSYLRSENKYQKTMLYSFWGSDMGFAIPWLHSKVDASVVRMHGYDLYAERSGYVPLQAEIVRVVDQVATISHHGKRYLVELYPEYAFKINTRYLGVKGPTLEISRKQTNVINMVSCSSIIDIKRVDLILEVAENLACEGHQVHWIHFGGGEKEVLLKQAVKQAMLKNDKLDIDLRGYTSNAEVLKHYEEKPVTLFLNLSTTEGLPVSIMEAASRNIPIVATDVGGTSELVGADHGTGILLYANSSVAEITEAVLELAGNINNLEPYIHWSKYFDASENSFSFAQELSQLIT